MPELLIEQTHTLQWSDLRNRTYRPRPNTEERSAGIHLSGIIKSALMSKQEWTKEDETDECGLAVFLGVAWEEAAVSLWPEITWQTGEVEKDGIYMSPDGVLSDGGSCIHTALAGEEVLCEFKYTLKSEWKHGKEKLILQEKLWMWQLMGYCHAMGLEYAWLHVCWAAGDYRPPSPKYVSYLIRFKKRELELLWERGVMEWKGRATAE